MTVWCDKRTGRIGLALERHGKDYLWIYFSEHHYKRDIAFLSYKWWWIKLGEL